ncbi:hypothetical protein ACFV6Z_29750 [Streptomyces sp. NPDC059818]|uniref:hypothetical protein n=1 Tax=Streptomyces sp. NPDC059818 TaxID=3346962 RepID=UPI00365D2BD5
MKHAPQGTIKLPRRMEHLAADQRGYPVIATVERSSRGDFGSINERRKLALATFDWCAVCGQPFAGELRWQTVFDEGPLPVAVVTGEAPVHEVCALYAAQVCPFLFSPQARLGDEFRKGAMREPLVRFVGFESTSAVFAHESVLQKGVHTVHFEHRGQADEFSYHSPDEIRDRFADALAQEQDLPVSDAEGVLIRLFNRLDDGGEGDVVTGAALIAGAAFAKDVFKVQKSRLRRPLCRGARLGPRSASQYSSREATVARDNRGESGSRPHRFPGHSTGCTAPGHTERGNPSQQWLHD